jgi:hypothetical protein
VARVCYGSRVTVTVVPGHYASTLPDIHYSTQALSLALARDSRPSEAGVVPGDVRRSVAAATLPALGSVRPGLTGPVASGRGPGLGQAARRAGCGPGPVAMAPGPLSEGRYTSMGSESVPVGTARATGSGSLYRVTASGPLDWRNCRSRWRPGRSIKVTM